MKDTEERTQEDKLKSTEWALGYLSTAVRDVSSALHEVECTRDHLKESLFPQTAKTADEVVDKLRDVDMQLWNLGAWLRAQEGKK